MRLTFDLDEPLLGELTRLQNEEGKTLGQLVSELVTGALSERMKGAGGRSEFVWTSKPMGSVLDLGNKDAVHAALESEGQGREP